MCDAATSCAETGDSQGYLSFDLHYLISNSSWECVLYYDPNQDASYFNVADSDAYLSFGFS